MPLVIASRNGHVSLGAFITTIAIEAGRQADRQKMMRQADRWTDGQKWQAETQCTYESRHSSSLGNFCLGLKQGSVCVGAVEWGLEGYAPQTPGTPQLQQGLLAGCQGQHCLNQWPA